jgi:hypothetical protein
LEGKLHLGKNWIVKGWQKAKEGFAGSIDGTDALIEGDDPGLAADSYRPLPGSPCIDAAGPLPSSISAEHPVTRTLDGTERAAVGKGMDLGALEAQ